MSTRGWLSRPREMIAGRRWQSVLIAFAIFVLGNAVFLPGLSYPAKTYFDEVHYVPDARQILAGVEPGNPEHPPLGKALIAFGMALWGDTPFGWRFMSACFGALTLAGIYVWALQLFRSRNAALWATAITLVNQILYVQSRIAMLDIFMMAFIVWAMAAFTASWTHPRARLLLTATGTLLGLAAACKWLGIVPWIMVAGIVIGVRILQHWRTRFEGARDGDWYRLDLWRQMTAWDWIVSLGLAPAIAYLAAFVPIYGFDLAGLMMRQLDMWNGVTSAPANHPYMSRWIDWPILRRPIWYFFEAESPEAAPRAVLYLGNPLVMWCGIPAILACLHGWLAKRRRDAFVIFAAWLSLYIFWALVPRQLAFHYYYFPSGMIVSLALAYLFHETPLVRYVWARSLFLVLSLGVFLYFLPITSAAVTVTIPEFNNMMWFKSWR